MIKLYLARHGQTKENIERIFQGHLPGNLTQEGVEQAEHLCESLKNIEFDVAVCSDLQRAIDTMNIVINPHNISFSTTSLLREIDWGSWTGRKICDVDINNIPSDVETEEMLYKRGEKVVEFLKDNFSDKTVLAIGHGLINRAIQANIDGVTLNDLRMIPKMNNAEFRIFEI